MPTSGSGLLIVIVCACYALRVPMVTLEMLVNVVLWELMERRHEYNTAHRAVSQELNRRLNNCA